MSRDRTKHFLIEGRSRMFSNGPRISIYEGSDTWGEPVFVLTEASLREDWKDGMFQISVTHYDASDIEHDSSYVFTLEGLGLTYKETYGPLVRFNAVAMGVQMYPAGWKAVDGAVLPQEDDDQGKTLYTCDYEQCPEPHLVMPFTPPEVKWTPKKVLIELDFHAKKHTRTDVITTVVEKTEA
jgi:hypothetical protein